MKTEQIKDLLRRYNAGQASADEIAVVDRWVNMELEEGSWEKTDQDKRDFGIALKQRIDTQISQDIQRDVIKPIVFRVKKYWYISGIAALLALAVFATVIFWKLKNDDAIHRYANDVAPGKNLAILTLANGQKINLDDKAGTLDTLNGIKIEKAKSGVIVFKILNNASTGNNLPNTIETPEGGQYQVLLADGTKVWLNSATTFKFPARFGTTQKRQVSLNGEAYFEVAKDHLHPFVVNTARQEVEVLGTHFNMNAYDEEWEVKTTLIEGSVKVSGSGEKEVLSPNQQAISTKGALIVKEVDPALSTDWKNGEFRFKNEPLESILRKLSRWYGVTFVNELNETKRPYFTGSVSRFDHISSVLTMLEETGNIRFYINNKVITVK